MGNWVDTGNTAGSRINLDSGVVVYASTPDSGVTWRIYAAPGNNVNAAFPLKIGYPDLESAVADLKKAFPAPTVDELLS